VYGSIEPLGCCSLYFALISIIFTAAGTGISNAPDDVIAGGEVLQAVTALTLAVGVNHWAAQQLNLRVLQSLSDEGGVGPWGVPYVESCAVALLDWVERWLRLEPVRPPSLFLSSHLFPLAPLPLPLFCCTSLPLPLPLPQLLPPHPTPTQAHPHPCARALSHSLSCSLARLRRNTATATAVFLHCANGLNMLPPSLSLSLSRADVCMWWGTGAVHRASAAAADGGGHDRGREGGTGCPVVAVRASGYPAAVTSLSCGRRHACAVRDPATLSKHPSDGVQGWCAKVVCD
jgi:hypothetical protein